MDNALEALAAKYFAEQLETDWSTLLAPLADTPPAGETLAGTPHYGQIRRAREEEDASLPLGAWERELKRADWLAVSRLCVQALATRSKDLQLAAWLLEAEIHRHGFAALAPGLVLIAQLCQRYWQALYPTDLEHRDNLFRWIDDKLCLPLRRAPFTATGGAHDYGWADWEQAQRNEQIRAALGREAEAAIEGTTLNVFGAALACTPSPALMDSRARLAAALAALGALDAGLKAQLGAEAPRFDNLRGLLENIALMLESEARKRGLTQPAEAEPAAIVPAPTADEPAPAAGAEGSADRRRLYSALAQTADQLARLEPHSPVPYLIRRAVEWGALNTAQLYNEVFVRCGGQINIFELLGLEEQIAAQQDAG